VAVATDYLSILSLDQMKSELRLDGVDDLDAAITSQIRAAGSYVAQRTSLPIISQERTWDIECFPPEKVPIDIPFTHVYEVPVINYWDNDGDYREAPNRQINGGDLGRVVPYRIDVHYGAHIYWPVGGWPEAMESNGLPRIEIVCRRGLNPVADAIRQAMILVARDYFEGHRNFPPGGHSVDILLRPFIRMGFAEEAERNRRLSMRVQ